MIQRRTQTATYWQSLDLGPRDVSFLYEHILDTGQPVSTAALVTMLIERHCRREEESVRSELSDGKLYLPQETYEIGEDLIFPALGLVRGTVVGTRPGYNPEYGDFTVIEVEFQDNSKKREFALAA